MARKQRKKREAISRLDSIMKEVRAELERAIKKHGGMSSAHEGWAVIQEEADELWDEVKADRGYQDSGRAEAIQVAAMGIKYVAFLCR